MGESTTKASRRSVSVESFLLLFSEASLPNPVIAHAQHTCTWMDDDVSRLRADGRGAFGFFIVMELVCVCASSRPIYAGTSLQLQEETAALHRVHKTCAPRDLSPHQQADRQQCFCGMSSTEERTRRRASFSGFSAVQGAKKQDAPHSPPRAAGERKRLSGRDRSASPGRTWSARSESLGGGTCLQEMGRNFAFVH